MRRIIVLVTAAAIMAAMIAATAGPAAAASEEGEDNASPFGWFFGIEGYGGDLPISEAAQTVNQSDANYGHDVVSPLIHLGDPEATEDFFLGGDWESTL